MNEEYKFKTTGEMLINFKPSYTITVGNADGEVGRLDFSGPKLIFIGDAEESAKVFLDSLSRGWSKRLQKEREAEREACARLCDENGDKWADGNDEWRNGQATASYYCAIAIRARGET